jgi:hypothetical protein
MESGSTVRSEMFSAEGVRHHRGWILALFAIALLVQLVALRLTFVGNDAVYYYDDVKIALNILDGNGYAVSNEYRNWFFYEVVLKSAKLDNPITTGTKTTAIKQPVYGLLLTALFYLFGAKNFLVLFLVHSVISALTISLLFVALRGTAPFGALAAALGATIYPPLVLHSVSVPESTALLLLIIALVWLWLVKVRERPSRGLWILGGALGGLAVLTDPVTLPFIAICACYGLWLDGRSLRKRLSAFAVAGAVGFVIVSPWLVRNYIVFHRFPVLKSGVGQAFNWGLHFGGQGTWISEDRLVTMEKAGRSLTELEEDEALRRELLVLFPRHWREYVTYNVPLHVLHLWWDVPRYWNDYSLRYMAGRRVPYLLLLVLALPYVFRTTVRFVRQPRTTLHNDVLLVSAVILAGTYTAVYGVFGAFHSRYRLPVELGLFIFAGMTLAPTVESVWKKWVSPLGKANESMTEELPGLDRALSRDTRVSP